MNWYVYIIETDDKSFYTGITTDVERRFKQHEIGKGAKFFNIHKPKKIVYIEDGHTRSSAGKRELEIKKLSNAKKQELISKELVENEIEGQY